MGGIRILSFGNLNKNRTKSKLKVVLWFTKSPTKAAILNISYMLHKGLVYTTYESEKNFVGL